MFGKNPIRSKTSVPEALSIETIFYTIQGEGPYGGMPCLFIRLSGCNLACTFCDTEFEKNAEVLRPIKDIMDEVLSHPAAHRRLVVITGGEPLRQNITDLCEALLTSGTELIQVETSGTLWQHGLDRIIAGGRLVLVCSPKTPGINPFIMQFCNHWKYIIKHDEVSPVDGLPNVGVQPGTEGKEQRIYRPWGTAPRAGTGRFVVWVSPCDEYDAKRNQLNIGKARDVSLEHGYRLSLQMHKIIGVE